MNGVRLAHLSDYITEKDEVKGWEAVTPTQRPRKRIKNIVEQLWYEHNEAVNRYMDGKGSLGEIERRRVLAERAEEQQDQCTCTPRDEQACPACREFLSKQEMPY